MVTAPDYVGAGGTGGTGAGERYLIAAEQSRDLLNGVRAARNISEAGAGMRFATYGHSQGGLASLSGAALAHTYAPELTLIADGAASAASDVGALFDRKWTSSLAGWLLGAPLTTAWTRYYPDLNPGAILTTAGQNHYQETAGTSCLNDILPILVNPLMGAFFAKDPTTDPDWRKAFIANQAPLPPGGVPVFVAHGLDDMMIDPALSTGLVSRYCDEAPTSQPTGNPAWDTGRLRLTPRRSTSTGSLESPRARRQHLTAASRCQFRLRSHSCSKSRAPDGAHLYARCARVWVALGANYGTTEE